MCFDNDYDWYAEVQETKEGPLTGDRTTCDECRAPIRPGDWCRKVFQQEHESCQVCEEDGDDPECEHDYGQTFNYICCRGCATILEAIEEVEEKEGCPWYARQPAMTELWETLCEHESSGKYMEAAVDKDESLTQHPLILRAIGCL